MAAADATFPDGPDTARDASVARRRGLRLEYLTIGWNVVEVLVTIALGLAAHSLALIAFGVDSLVEVFASVVVVWHIVGAGRGVAEHRRTRALRLVAIAFALLAFYLLASSAHSLLARQHPDSSPWGIAYLAVTALVMFTLAWRKRIVGDSLGEDSLAAEARMTFLDGWLAVGVLAALAATAWLGWWWADALAAAGVAVAAVPEALENWRAAGEAA